MKGSPHASGNQRPSSDEVADGWQPGQAVGALCMHVFRAFADFRFVFLLIFQAG